MVRGVRPTRRSRLRKGSTATKSSTAGRTAAPDARGAPLVRTCVGCRRRATASELLRVIAVGSGVDQFVLRPDPDRTMPGRGAHVHPTTACLESALRRRAFGRALRIAGVIDTGELNEAILRVGRPSRVPAEPDGSSPDDAGGPPPEQRAPAEDPAR